VGNRQSPGYDSDIVNDTRSAEPPTLAGDILLHDLPGGKMKFAYDFFQILKYPVISVGKGDNRLIDYGQVIETGKVVERAGTNISLDGILKKPARVRPK
jgi:hypothetical protein